ncbi:MAG: hypothetical protein AB7V16_07195 [Vulcanibacillus sp.]
MIINSFKIKIEIEPSSDIQSAINDMVRFCDTHHIGVIGTFNQVEIEVYNGDSVDDVFKSYLFELEQTKELYERNFK